MSHDVKSEFTLVNSRNKKFCENYVENEINKTMNKSYSDVINTRESANSITNRLEYPYLPNKKLIPNKTIQSTTNGN